MQFFMFSPLEMSEAEAYCLASPHLDHRHTVVVRSAGVSILPPKPGQRVQALPGTYLVRVEQDGLLRVVQKALDNE
jgi:hypothetical protein